MRIGNINSFDKSLFSSWRVYVLSSLKASLRSLGWNLALLNFWTLRANFRMYFITFFVYTTLSISADMASPGFSEIEQHTEEKVERCTRGLKNIIEKNRTTFFSENVVKSIHNTTHDLFFFPITNLYTWYRSVLLILNFLLLWKFYIIINKKYTAMKKMKLINQNLHSCHC